MNSQTNTDGSPLSINTSTVFDSIAHSGDRVSGGESLRLLPPSDGAPGVAGKGREESPFALSSGSPVTGTASSPGAPAAAAAAPSSSSPNANTAATTPTTTTTTTNTSNNNNVSNNSKNSEANKCNLYFSNLPFSFRSPHLKKLCHRFGNICTFKISYHARTNTSLRYGFVLFFQESAAENCIRSLNGKKIIVYSVASNNNGSNGGGRGGAGERHFDAHNLGDSSKIDFIVCEPEEEPLLVGGSANISIIESCIITVKLAKMGIVPEVAATVLLESKHGSVGVDGGNNLITCNNNNNNIVISTAGGSGSYSSSNSSNTNKKRGNTTNSNNNNNSNSGNWTGSAGNSTVSANNNNNNNSTVGGVGGANASSSGTAATPLLLSVPNIPVPSGSGLSLPTVLYHSNSGTSSVSNTHTHTHPHHNNNNNNNNNNSNSSFPNSSDSREVSTPMGGNFANSGVGFEYGGGGGNNNNNSVMSSNLANSSASVYVTSGSPTLGGDGKYRQFAPQGTPLNNAYPNSSTISSVPLTTTHNSSASQASFADSYSFIYDPSGMIQLGGGGGGGGGPAFLQNASATNANPSPNSGNYSYTSGSGVSPQQYTLVGAPQYYPSVAASVQPLAVAGPGNPSTTYQGLCFPPPPPQQQQQQQQQQQMMFISMLPSQFDGVSGTSHTNVVAGSPGGGPYYVQYAPASATYLPISAAPPGSGSPSTSMGNNNNTNNNTSNTTTSNNNNNSLPGALNAPSSDASAPNEAHGNLFYPVQQYFFNNSNP